jgi:hypothetical protein
VILLNSKEREISENDIKTKVTAEKLNFGP